MTSPLLNLTPNTDPFSAAPPENAAVDTQEFIYLLSHDLRSSIRALLELPEWIAEDLEESGLEVSASVLDSISLMKRHTRRLDRMLIDLLEYSRTGEGQNVQKVNLRDACDAALEELRLPSEFRFNQQFNCQAFPICEQDLNALFTALIGNAVKHHDQLSGIVEVMGRMEGTALVLTISDDGPGILPEFHERVFRPLTTLRARDDVEGSGLGLAIVRKIARCYNGSARILFGQKGRGTTVEVRLQTVTM